MPLLPDQGLAEDVVRNVRQSAKQYEQTLDGKRIAGRLLRDDELTTIAFQWHRSRYIDQAMHALDYERELKGDAFDLTTLTGRGTQVTVLCEVAGLLSLWSTESVNASALAVLSSGLRSAFWLWLEDDDRSMATLRCVLEQAARLHTHRLKPEKAGRLEADSRTTPSDWLEAAGWRRMSPLLRALSEFSHGQASARWAGAWKLLSSIQAGSEDDDRVFPAFQTARGNALEFVTRVMALELTRYAEHTHDEATSRSIELAIEEMLLDVDPEPSWLNQTLDRIWSYRETALGAPDIRISPNSSPDLKQH
jgi:hypothetical protein